MAERPSELHAADAEALRTTAPLDAAFLRAQCRIYELIARSAPLADILEAIVGAFSEQCDAGASAEVMLSAAPEAREAAASDAPTVAPPPGDAPWSWPILSATSQQLGRIEVRLRNRTALSERESRVINELRSIAALAVERHITEEAAYHDKARMELVHGADVGLWYCALPFGTLYWDDKVREHFHMPPGAVVTIDLFYERIHPDDRERTRAAIEATIAHGAPYDIDYRTVSPDGSSVKWIRAVGRCFYDSRGTPVRFDGLTRDITSRKRDDLAQAAAALEKTRLYDEVRRSEERYKLAAQATSEAIWDWDLASNRIEWSNAITEIFGHADAADGTHADWWKLLIHPDDRERVVRGIHAAIDGNAPDSWQAEYRFRRGDGTWADVDDRGAVIRDAAGAPLRMVGAMLDVSRRKQMEQALRDSEARYRFMTESIPQIVWTARPDGVTNYHNHRLDEFTGATRQELARLGWTHFRHPDDREHASETWKQAFATGTPYECEYRLRAKDGEYRWHLARATPMRNERGEIVLWCGTCTDIHESRTQQDALRESEARFRAMADSAPVLVWISDTTGDSTWFNKGWLDFTGRSMADECGKGWTAGIHPDDLARCLETYTDAFARREELRTEYRLRRRDGEYRWMLDHCLPRYGEDGAFWGYIGSCIDVTENVNARHAMQQHGERLEKLVSERTVELERSHQRLRLAERVAALGTLSAGLGHDMGNILLPMRMRLETLAAMNLGESAHIEIQAIGELLDYLRKLSTGLRQLAADPHASGVGEPTAIQAWWADTESLLRNALPRGVTFQAEMPAAPCWVRMTRPALTQALFNLVQNAGHQMRMQEKGAVTVSGRITAGRMVISVTDTGPGMTPEVRERCMEPFFTTKARGISTGLGLPLVYGLVREAGGSIDVESEPGRGATFRIALPLVEPPRSRPLLRRAIVDVEDPRTRAVIAAELRMRDYEVHTSATNAPTDVDLMVVDASRAVQADCRVVPVIRAAKIAEIRKALDEATTR